jgi:hypothetical protein
MVLSLIQGIEREIVPERERLEEILEEVGISDAATCSDEIESFEREIGDRASERWTDAMIALVGLLRYAKCVLFSATPRPSDSKTDSIAPSSRALPRVSATALAFARSMRARFVSARPPPPERRGRRPDAHEWRRTRAGGQWTCVGGLRTRPRWGVAVGDVDGGAAQMSSRRGAAITGPG